MPHQKGNSHNLRLAQRENAWYRRCDHCDRKAALGVAFNYGRGTDAQWTERECRYCGAVQIIGPKGKRTMTPEEVANVRRLLTPDE